jgi:hypothetical protein
MEAKSESQMGPKVVATESGAEDNDGLGDHSVMQKLTEYHDGVRDAEYTV